MKYKFESIETEIENPTVILDGDVGTKILNNVAQSKFFVWILLITDHSRVRVMLEGETVPVDWSIESIQSWVEDQLIKYQV